MSTLAARVADLENDLRSQIRVDALARHRLDVIDRHRQELAAVGEVIAVVRDAVERLADALAAYDTLPTGAEPDPTVPTVPEHEDPARLRGQLADAHADCARYAAERDEARAALRAIDDWGIRHSEALDAAATAQQLRDELRDGAQ